HEALPSVTSSSMINGPTSPLTLPLERLPGRLDSQLPVTELPATSRTSSRTPVASPSLDSYVPDHVPASDTWRANGLQAASRTTSTEAASMAMPRERPLVPPGSVT